MKKDNLQYWIFLFFLLSFGVVRGQEFPPSGINYAAVAVDLEGRVAAGVDVYGFAVRGREIGVRFSLLSSSGDRVYSEEHRVETDAFGLFSVIIGSGKVVGGLLKGLEEIDWRESYSLRVEWDTEGRGMYRVVGEQVLKSVPYALYSGLSGGEAGESVYEFWLGMGNEGDKVVFFQFLRGSKGDQGEEGERGPRGDRGAEGDLKGGSGNGTLPYWKEDAWALDNESLYTDGIGMAMGKGSIEPTAALELTSEGKGFLTSRMTIEQRDQIRNASDGLMIFNTTTGCPNYYYAGLWYEWCGRESILSGNAEVVECELFQNIGSIWQGDSILGAYTLVNYFGGNGGIISDQLVASEGLGGLHAKLLKDTLVQGNGILRIEILGRALSEGLAFFPMRLAGRDCVLEWEVKALVEPIFRPEAVHCDPENITIVKPVLNPQTGKVWMDRNLGAGRVAESPDDEEAYGDLYQWGRFSDGHQCRNSDTTHAMSSLDQPIKGDFIIHGAPPFDWRSPQNDDLWLGLGGINNPCPGGYRLPTNVELQIEFSTWSGNGAEAGFNSSLKLTTGGMRHGSINEIREVGLGGNYWSGTIAIDFSLYLVFGAVHTHIHNDARVHGRSVRCIRD
jgi:hypothetical protein